jgi:hypothetical protein
MQNGDGSNSLRLNFNQIFPGLTISELIGNFGTGATAETFVLDATGPGANTQFFGDTANPITIVVDGNGNPWKVTFDGPTPVTRQLTSGVDDQTFTGITGQFTEIRFTLATNIPGGSLNVSSLVATVNCFCAGTRIATRNGLTKVEDLSAGERIFLADGRETEVLWLGRQVVDTSVTNPREINPIRITKGALGGGLPERDLRLSPDHALAIDGYLINAGALVNGSTIYQEHDVTEDFTYYHIETDAHELILAEGVAAETFIDYTTRDTFENAHEAPDRMIEEMPLPRISSARLVPEHIMRKLTPVMAAE